MQNGYSLRGKKVWVAGHRGMVGSALVRRLQSEACEVLTAGRDELDLRQQSNVARWVAAAKPDAIFLAAAKVGGILANRDYPGAFLYDNLAIAGNIVEAARISGVERLLFLGSSCIYPKLAPQPIKEDALLTGALEETNEWYAIAKIAGVKLCDAYRRQYGCHFVSAMPTNLYGPGDNYDLSASHVLPALLRKIHAAKKGMETSVPIWGSGQPLREFLHVDDLADACVFLMQRYDQEGPINVGSGQEVRILQLAEMIAEVVGYNGTFEFDSSKPDGTPRKLLDSGRLEALGWKASISLRDGVARTYRDLLAGHGSVFGWAA